MNSAFKTVFATVVLMLGNNSVTLAQQISCGDRPKIQSSVEEKLKKDAEGQAQLLTRLLGNADIKGAIESSRTELYQQHQDVGRDEIDLYFAWVSCQTITFNKDLSATEKIEKWMQVYKILLARSHSGFPTNESKTKPPPTKDASIFFVDGLKFLVKRLVLTPGNREATLILSVTNINDEPTKIVFLPPYPTLTDEDGNSGHLAGTEGAQICGYDAQNCARVGRLFSIQPNFPVNVIVKFHWPSGNSKPISASFASKIAIYRDEKTNKAGNVAEASLAFPDIPFTSN